MNRCPKFILVTHENGVKAHIAVDDIRSFHAVPERIGHTLLVNKSGDLVILRESPSQIKEMIEPTVN